MDPPVPPPSPPSKNDPPKKGKGNSKSKQDGEERRGPGRPPKKRPPLGPPVIVDNVRPSDILFGRGQPFHQHPGNRVLKAVISDNRQKYAAARKEEKGEIINFVIRQVQGDGPGGSRFLKKVDATANAQWCVAPLHEVYKKVSHALRDNHRNTKRGSRASVGRSQNVRAHSGGPTPGAHADTLVSSSTHTHTGSAAAATTDVGRRATTSATPSSGHLASPDGNPRVHRILTSNVARMPVVDTGGGVAAMDDISVPNADESDTEWSLSDATFLDSMYEETAFSPVGGGQDRNTGIGMGMPVPEQHQHRQDEQVEIEQEERKEEGQEQAKPKTAADNDEGPSHIGMICIPENSNNNAISFDTNARFPIGEMLPFTPDAGFSDDASMVDVDSGLGFDFVVDLGLVSNGCGAGGGDIAYVSDHENSEKGDHQVDNDNDAATDDTDDSITMSLADIDGDGTIDIDSFSLLNSSGLHLSITSIGDDWWLAMQ